MRNAKPSRVAIIGGGIAGLTCAQTLRPLAPHVEVVVYDTGKHDVGGRCSSKRVAMAVAGGQESLLFDHSAQYVSGPVSENDPFKNILNDWIRMGHVRCVTLYFNLCMANVFSFVDN